MMQPPRYLSDDHFAHVCEVVRSVSKMLSDVGEFSAEFAEGARCTGHEILEHLHVLQHHGPEVSPRGVSPRSLADV